MHEVDFHFNVIIKIFVLCAFASLMFEIRHRNAPGNIQGLFQHISDIHSYNTRSSASNNFYTQSFRLPIQVNSFYRSEKIYEMKCLYLSENFQKIPLRGK